jgi:hypothetical protein
VSALRTDCEKNAAYGLSSALQSTGQSNATHISWLLE